MSTLSVVLLLTGMRLGDLVHSSIKYSDLKLTLARPLEQGNHGNLVRDMVSCPPAPDNPHSL